MVMVHGTDTLQLLVYGQIRDSFVSQTSKVQRSLLVVKEYASGFHGDSSKHVEAFCENPAGTTRSCWSKDATTAGTQPKTLAEKKY